MKKNMLSIFILTMFLSCAWLMAQESQLPATVRKATAGPEEIVSFASSTSFEAALIQLNGLSKKFLNKILVKPDVEPEIVGVDIDKQHWLTALELMLRQNDLWYEEHADYINITSLHSGVSHSPGSEDDAAARYETREVVISAVFFEADVSKLRQVGSNWTFLQDGNPNTVIRNSSADASIGLFEMDLSPNLSFGDLFATFKTLESDQVGEVVASPKITVGSGEQGSIQVGSDIQVTLQDFAGNAVTQFFSTGSIIKVKPEVIRHNNVDFIYLELDIERSQSLTGTAGLEIKKSSAKTSVYLLDGEETVIGGLYLNEETNTRQGLPILKDLPWWMFGLRYIFGYESRNVIKKELLILLKADLLPKLQARFEDKESLERPPDYLRDQRKNFINDLQYYRNQVNDEIAVPAESEKPEEK